MDQLAGRLQGAGFNATDQSGEAYELVRLREENLRLKREMEHLRATASLMLEESDMRRLASALARQAVALLDAADARILVIEEQTLLAHGESSAGESRTDFKWGAGAAGLAAKRMHAFVCQEGDGYVLGAPILDHQHRLLGVLEVSQNRAFSAESLAVAQTLALQAATGLERARLFERMRDWTHSLETLLSFNAATNQHLEPPQLVSGLVENAARFLKADGGMAGFAVSSPGGTAMVCDSYWHCGQWFEHQRRWQSGEGLPGLLLERSLPYFSNEYAEEPLADSEVREKFDVRRSMCVPITSADKSVLGFFELHKGPGQPPFTWQDGAFLESLANTTAVAIQNVQLLNSLAVKNEQIQALSAHNVKRLEEERSHIARELHDEAGQVLIGIKLSLQVLSRTLPPEALKLRQDLDWLRELVNRSTNQIKNIARRLRPPILDEMGLSITLRQLADDFERSSGIPVHCQLEELPVRLPADAETTLYRIAQEALTNAGKYAAPTLIRFSLTRREGSLTFCVEDDGKGFDKSMLGSGLGLLGMKERADMLKAEFSIHTAVGEGSRVTVTLPYE